MPSCLVASREGGSSTPSLRLVASQLVSLSQTPRPLSSVPALSTPPKLAYQPLTISSPRTNAASPRASPSLPSSTSRAGTPVRKGTAGGGKTVSVGLGVVGAETGEESQEVTSPHELTQFVSSFSWGGAGGKSELRRAAGGYAAKRARGALRSHVNGRPGSPCVVPSPSRAALRLTSGCAQLGLFRRG